MWPNDDQPIIQQHPSEDDGWKLVGDQYKPIWFKGDQEVLEQSSSDEEDVEGDGDDSADV